MHGSTIQVFCAESEDPLTRGSQTYYGTGTYRYFHYCSCHDKKCVARCSVCGPVDYSNASKHVRQNVGHSLLVEPTAKGEGVLRSYKYTPRRKRKSSGSEQNILPEEKKHDFKRGAFQAYKLDWINFEQYNILIHLIADHWSNHNVQMMLKYLRKSLDEQSDESWFLEGQPMISYFQFSLK